MKFLKIKKGKQIQSPDAESFTTIETLYDALDAYLCDQEAWSDFKRTRPSDSKVNQYYGKAVELWDTIQKYFPEVGTLAKSDKESAVAGKFRGTHGGHLLFRPVGLLLIIDVIDTLVREGTNVGGAVRRLAKAPMQLSNEPWSELLWNPVGRRMITARENRDVAYSILFYGVGGDLRDLKTTGAEVRQEWAGILNRPASAVKLRRWVRE